MSEPQSTADATPKLQWSTYFDQGEWWQPNHRPLIRIVDMDTRWRGNTARYLIRNAKKYADRVSFAENCTIYPFLSGMSDNTADSVLGDMQHHDAERTSDPVKWIRSTELYRALTDGLAVDASIDDVMAGQATRETLPAVCMIPDCGCTGEAHP